MELGGVSMSNEQGSYIGTCTYCRKEIRSNDYWEAFDGYGMHEIFCSRSCNDNQRELEPINHQAWKE